jgi:hypothetical protein
MSAARMMATAVFSTDSTNVNWLPDGAAASDSMARASASSVSSFHAFLEVSSVARASRSASAAPRAVSKRLAHEPSRLTKGPRPDIIFCCRSSERAFYSLEVKELEVLVTDALREKQILQRKTEFIWCAIKIRTL